MTLVLISIEVFYIPKKKKIRISRENWAGKFRSVVRDNKGRLITHSKWTRKQPLRVSASIFRQQGTIKKDTSINPLTRFNEVTTRGVGLKPKTRLKKYQYFLKAEIDGEDDIVARSKQHDIGFPLAESKQEALSRFYARMGQEFGESYSEDEGRRVVRNFEKTRSIRLSEGIIQYAPKKVKNDFLQNSKTNKAEAI